MPLSASAAVRNSEPILSVLRNELRGDESVLEVGSGCGYHAVTIAAAMPGLTWQTSDLRENHVHIEAQIAAASPENVLPPLSLDVRSEMPDDTRYDVVYSSNTAHIMSEAAAESMLRLAAQTLDVGGRFCYYGPIMRAGRFNTRSNAEFDASLRARDPSMGIRELDEFDTMLADAGFDRQRVYAMPSNNLFIIWVKTRSGE